MPQKGVVKTRGYYVCPKCNRRYNYALRSGKRVCRGCGNEWDVEQENGGVK